jgi:CheY-like chemotaxis protein
MDEETRRSSYKVLVADDDDTLRGMLRTAIENAGYQVETVADGDQAQRAYRQQCPDLLVADLVMPGINGQELANACREHCPDTILVFMSGYSEDELQELDIRQVVFIPKPLSPRKLIEDLDRLLGIGG